MNKAILGIKLGMAQIFADDGTVIPVTGYRGGDRVMFPKSRPRKKTVTAPFNLPLLTPKKNTTKPVLGHFKRRALRPKNI